MWPFGLKALGGNGWTSVVFSGRTVQLAHIRRRADERPELVGWESYPREGSDLDVVKRLRSGKRLGAGRCTLLLPHGQYQLLQVDAPAVAAEELRNAVRWKVKDMVDFPVEDAGIECLPRAAGARAGQIYTVAASRSVLQSWVRLFQDAKAPLHAIDVTDLAQRNVSALFEDKNRGLALLAFDDSGGRLSFTFQGELYFSRHIDVVTADMANASVEPGALYERVLLDVQRTLDNVDRSYSNIPIARVLVAPPPGAEKFVDYLRENLYQPVEMLDFAKHVDIAKVPVLAKPAAQGQALLAIGAALREEGVAPA
ncbi:MAG: agglutinin biogenesis protein MshI [Rhodocyclales bacterium]|nr:agglutinin biogenesis protein MshI [Rhodocyclales bacterium]